MRYAQDLAFKLAGKSIRANTVSPGNTYFEGGIWQWIETNDPALFAKALALNPTGAYGEARGGRPRRRLPREPGVQLHHGDEPRWSTGR